MAFINPSSFGSLRAGGMGIGKGRSPVPARSVVKAVGFHTAAHRALTEYKDKYLARSDKQFSSKMIR